MTRLARVAIALVWLYNGLWCKLLAGCPGHAAIVADVPGVEPVGGGRILAALGLLEAGLAAWVLSGRKPVLAALVQTSLLLAMNVGGLVWGRARIADPAAMVVNNLAFLALVWLHARASVPSSPRGRTAGETAWRGGRFDSGSGPPVLLFGRMYEDWRIEAETFPAGSSVFCIASAGCTALALASCGHAVTAVDVNPAQVDYLRGRLRGAPPREGAAERLLARGRRLLPAVGWSVGRRRHFLSLEDPSEQVSYWDSVLETARFRAVLRGLLEPRMLRLFYNDALLRALPDRFGDELRRRLRRAVSRHANRGNPYAWGLLLGEASPVRLETGRSASPLVVECADAAEYLERSPAGRFSAFSLSNIFDGADPVYFRRLWSAVRRAATPDAVVVVRSFGLPRDRGEEERAAGDRAMLWGRVSVTPVASGLIV